MITQKIVDIIIEAFTIVGMFSIAYFIFQIKILGLAQVLPNLVLTTTLTIIGYLFCYAIHCYVTFNKNN